MIPPLSERGTKSSSSFVLPEQLLEHKAPERLLVPCEDRLDDNAIVIAEADVVHAAAWYLQRHDTYLVGAGEIGYGLNYPDAAGRLEQTTHLPHRVALRREIWWAIACLALGTLLWLAVLYRMG